MYTDNSSQMLAEALTSKWKSVLENDSLPDIKDEYRRNCTAILLENQERFLQESAPVNNISGGNIGTWDPVLISMIRRSMPQLIAYDIMGVQPMTGPTGLIFALKSKYTSQSGDEAGFNEANAAFSATNAGGTFGNAQVGTDFSNITSAGWSSPTATNHPFNAPEGMTTAQVEALGDSASNYINEMAFSIDKVTVTAHSRALKAEYTTELQQDLKAIHGLDAETELANMLSQEILNEINREIVRAIYINAKIGCETGTTTTLGIFDMDTDANGRWAVEKFKGLHFQIEREANKIAVETRRGKGNLVICSADVASALSLAGILDYNPSMANDLNVDTATSTFAGILNGKMKVYVDPFFTVGSNGYQYATVGYRGNSAYDAGMFYCPYIPMEMIRAVGENTFTPRIAFKTRYGLVANPYVNSTGAIGHNESTYYRRIQIRNLM